MKYLIIILALFSTHAYAQSKSIVVDTVNSDVVYEKQSQDIKDRTKNDLEVIKEQTEAWSDEMLELYNKFFDIFQSLEYDLQEVQANNSEDPMDNESDPDIEAFAKDSVPVCTVATQRLVYYSNAWRCVDKVKCTDVNSAFANFKVVDGKCTRHAKIGRAT